MAITTPPRISFSHDLLPQMDSTIPVERYIRSNSSSPGIDFEFCVVGETFYQDQSSSADELFFDGKILPIEIKKKVLPPPPPPLQKVEPPLANSGETKMVDDVSESDHDQKQNTKSFWGFKRSSSYGGGGYGRSLCPLPPLSRSNSAGSATSSKKQHSHHKYSSMKQSQFMTSSSSNSHQKPPLKKNYGSHGSGVKFTPVLNVPTPSLFGLGSIFSGGKDKNKKR